MIYLTGDTHGEIDINKLLEEMNKRLKKLKEEGLM